MSSKRLRFCGVGRAAMCAAVLIVLLTVTHTYAGEMAFPGSKWEQAAPESQGVDAERLRGAIEYLKKHLGRDGVRELVSVRNGRVIRQGDNIDKVHGIDRVHGVGSCTKSFTSTVLGLLIEDGKSLNDEPASAKAPRRQTEVSIHGEQFFINGRPTYEGRTWRGHKIEGLLLNSRMVQGVFDDLNPETVNLWAYPDTGEWDAERNTREFIAAMPEWRRHGLLCFTINLQGGSPQGYSQHQPWHNSAFEADGSLRPAFMRRLERILDGADELGMVAILGLFYFGQDQRLENEAVVVRGVDNALDWLFDRGYRNVLIEVNNECNVRKYDHEILMPARVHELIERVRNREREGRRFLVSTSYGGGKVPEENVVQAADFLLLHGNGVKEPARIADMVRRTREVPGYRPMPILFNEDDHYGFDRPENNFAAALSEYASWGYFDYRQSGEPFEAGYQSVPVDWEIGHPRKRAFFEMVREVTGTGPAPREPR